MICFLLPALVHINNKEDKAVCGAELIAGDSLVETALASNCDACRNCVGIGGQREKTWEGQLLGVRPVPELDPNAEPLCDAAGKVYEREKL